MTLLAHIRHFLIKNECFTSQDEDFILKFDQTAIANSYDYVLPVQTYKISETTVLSMMWLGPYREMYFVGSLVSKRNRAHCLLEPVSMKEGVFKLIDTTKSKLIDGWNLVAFDAEPNDIYIEDIIAALPKNKWINSQVVDDPETLKVSIEIKENQIYFKSVLPIKAEDIGAVMSIIKNLEGI